MQSAFNISMASDFLAHETPSVFVVINSGLGEDTPAAAYNARGYKGYR